MKRILKLQSLIKRANSAEDEKDFQNFEKAKYVAENKVIVPIPGIEELKEMEAMAKKILSNDTITNPSGDLTLEEYQNIKKFLEEPETLSKIIKGGSQKEVVNLYFRKTAKSKIELEFSKFMFEKSIEYNSKYLGGDDFLALKKENFDKMLKDEYFLKSAGIVQYLEKISILKRADSTANAVPAVETGIWSKIKSFGKHLPLIAAIYEGYVFLQSLGNSKKAIDFIKSEYSDISNKEDLWKPEVIAELIEESKFNSEKFLKVALLNNSSKYLFEERVETIFRAITTILNFFIFFKILNVIMRILVAADLFLGLGALTNLVLSSQGINLGISEMFSGGYINNNKRIIEIANIQIEDYKSEQKGSKEQDEKVITNSSDEIKEIELEQVTVF